MKLFKDIEENIGTIFVIWLMCIASVSILYLIQLTGNNEIIEQVQYIETIRYATKEEQVEHDREEIEILAKTVYGEARGCSKTEQAAVIWCALNRVDSPDFPDNIIDVITQENQFTGYHENNPIYEEYIELANDVMTRWEFEKTAVGNVGRVLPKEYLWFRGVNGKNVFRDSYKEPYNTWDWSLERPYKE